jgi:hypothetical protein
MVHLPLKTLIREKKTRIWSHIFKMAPLPLKTLIRENNARVWSVCRRGSKEIHVLVLRGTYNIADVRIRKILFNNYL